jgi:hypothetical protein
MGTARTQEPQTSLPGEEPMKKDAAFSASKQMCGLYAGFFKGAAEVMGVAKAVEIHAIQGKPFAAAVSSTLKEKLGKKKLNYAAFESVYAGVREALGFKDEYRKGRSVLKVETLRCPVYEGYATAGLDHKTIEMMCRQMATLEYDEIKKTFPEFSGCLKFRSAPDEQCVEEFVILK